ncbi:MAG TPA: FlgD immunoglobulin-like domain containing protein [Candidatus Krumholzibacteria bacterium]
MTNLYPPDQVAGLPLELALQWMSSNPDGVAMNCDLYFGTTAVPPLVAANIPGIVNWAYAPPRLLPDTVYFWRVVARDEGGTETSGPTWTFSTVSNSPPVVQLLEPANMRVEVSVTTTLKWSGYDETHITFDVYLGTDSANLPRVANGITAMQYSPQGLAYLTTYYWRVVAHDLDGAETVSETWQFSTHAENAPNRPQLIEPASGSTNNSVINLWLGWRCTDPEGQALKYDVYFGTANDPPLVSFNQSDPYYNTYYLEVETKYYWRIVARDTDGLTRSGATWDFTTHANSVPYVPSNPDPHIGETRQPLNTQLVWYCRDPDGQGLRYDVYFGTVNPPPLLVTNIGGDRWYPGAQTVLTTYYWRIVARDPKGAESSGPVWYYTTKSPDEPPNVPGVPKPADGATAQPINTALSWYADDPENQSLNFDVYFGPTDTPPLIADHVATKSYTPGLLATSTVYRWRVVSRDPAGHETSSPLWSFRTASISNLPPRIPSNPGPPDGGVVNSTLPLLTWEGSDPDGDALQYQVFMYIYDTFPDYLGTTTTPSFQMTQALVPGWTYYWGVYALDGHWYTQSPLWSFTVSPAVPVAITTFEAKQNGAAVDVRWELTSDDAMERYTLYRRTKDDEPVMIAQGPVENAKSSFRDAGVETGQNYSYELVVLSVDGNEFRSPRATVVMAKLELALYQNVPNPFNPQTSIRYDLPDPAHTRLSIFDVGGRLVRVLVEENRPAGAHVVTWAGRDDAGNPVSSGVYFYVLEAGKQRLTRKLVLLK